MNYERAFLTSEVAERLNCAQSTIRKYAIALEKQDRQFAKNEKGARLFTEADVATLARMKELSDTEKLPIDRIAGLMSAVPAAPRDEMRSVEANAPAEIMTELAALREENAEIKKALIHTNEQLAAVLNELQESRKLIAAASEQPDEETSKPPEKKSWWRFW